MYKARGICYSQRMVCLSNEPGRGPTLEIVRQMTCKWFNLGELRVISVAGVLRKLPLEAQ